MSKRFVHVGISFATRIKILELEPIFTAIGEDWIRYSPTNWILWTDKPTAHIITLLLPSLDQPDQVLISAIGTDMFGHLSPWIWDWMNSKTPNMFMVGEEAKRITRLPASILRSSDEDQ